MKRRFKNGTLRLKSWNYSNPGFYFITFSTFNKIPYFGEVRNGKMIYSGMGKIAVKYWNYIPRQFPFIKLDVFQIMPDHIHVVIYMQETNHISTKGYGGVTGSKNPMGKGTTGEIIRWYKGRVTFEINKRFPESSFYWQSRYYDHIIRNNVSLNRIRKYIKNNPKNYHRKEILLVRD